MQQESRREDELSFELIEECEDFERGQMNLDKKLEDWVSKSLISREQANAILSFVLLYMKYKEKIYYSLEKYL